MHDDASALLLLQILVHGNGWPSLTLARTTYGTESKFHVYKAQVKKVKPSSTETASDRSEWKEEKGKEIETARLGPFSATMNRFGVCVCTTRGSLASRERDIFNSTVPN
jgi:hypothetical protein